MFSQSPSFYLWSHEEREFGPVRACFLTQTLRGHTGTAYLLVKINPPLIGQKYGTGGQDIDVVVLAPRFAGRSLSPISEWPMHVHVALLCRDVRTITSPDDLKLLTWAELYRTEGEAITATTGR